MAAILTQLQTSFLSAFFQLAQKLGIPSLPVEITPFFKHFRVGPTENPLTLHFSKDVPFHIKPPNHFGDILVDSIEAVS